MNTAPGKRGRRTAVRATLLLVLALCGFAGTGHAQAPIIDGNGDDLIAFATGFGKEGCWIDRADPRDDVVVADPKIDPCSTLEDTDGDGATDYYVNGMDLRRFVTVYDEANQDLYILFRAEGVIGDVDGNGNPDNNLCAPAPSFSDQVGIGSDDRYEAHFDLDCDGEADLIVRVQDNQVTVTGLSFGGTSFAFSGSDLEVAVTDIVLPHSHQVFAFVGSIRDGLGEDVTPLTSCGTFELDFDLVKSVEPATICPGQTADFTLVLTNTGNVELSGITLTDDLPAGLVYQSTPTNGCGGAFAQAGQQLTYGPFALAVGASCTIVIRVGRTAECAGEQTNQAYVEGSFQTPCLNNGKPVVISDTASATLSCGSCPGENCPRTVGFWGAQCAQRGNGSTKFSASQMTAIAECIDDRSEFFNWSAGTDFDMFCRLLNPSNPMTQRKQAKRQFAGVLANYCTDFLNLQPSQGGKIYLDPSTPISCEGLEADTIGELIDEVDDILAELEGQDLNDPAVKDAYGDLISCLDAINNGINIPVREDCENEVEKTGEALGQPSTDGVALLNRAVPNPFTGSMSYAFEVVGQEQQVDIGVYNVAGRLVKSLSRMALPAGRHTVTWNGTDEGGARVPGGVYFVRVRLGGESQQHRVIFLGR